MSLVAPPPSLPSRPDGVAVRLRTALGRPRDVLPATRWLFARLALLSLAVTLPVPLLTADLPAALVVLGAAGTLAASWTIGYLRGRTAVAADLVDAAAVLAFALASDPPSVVLAALVSALWFRSLDGTALRAYLRAAGYALALVVAVLLWPHVGDRAGGTDAAPVLATAPILVLTVVVARRLSWMFEERRRRDAVAEVYAAAIEQLLGVTEDEAIRRVAADADRGFCAAIPGLRIAKVDRVGADLVVQGVRGPWAREPERVPAALVVADPDGGAAGGSHGGSGEHGSGEHGSVEHGSVEHGVTDPDGLDGFAGERCAWLALSLPVVPRLGVQSWLLMGAPGAVPEPVARALRNLANHMALAYAVADAHDVLIERATTDALTGLANRAAFTGALEAALADDAQSHVSVLFVDMDAFKEINDRLGHHAGDQVLRDVASRLRRASRPDDVCARLGGDEFAVLLPGADARAAAVAAQRVAAAVRAPLRRAGDVVAPLSASVGCATAPTGTDAEDLLRNADAAMYEAKRIRG